MRHVRVCAESRLCLNSSEFNVAVSVHVSIAISVYTWRSPSPLEGKWCDCAKQPDVFRFFVCFQGMYAHECCKSEPKVGLLSLALA